MSASPGQSCDPEVRRRVASVAEARLQLVTAPFHPLLLTSTYTERDACHHAFATLFTTNMVSAYLSDALRDPTGELQELYASSTSDDFPAEVTKHFARVFEKNEAFNQVCPLLAPCSRLTRVCSQIPTLDLQRPPATHAPRALVRFRGMVQDPSTSAEMYLSRSKSGKLSGWGIEHEEATDRDDVELENLRECNVLWAISVPGESSWVAEELDGRHGGEKRVVYTYTSLKAGVHVGSSSESQIPLRPHKSPFKGDVHLGVQIKVYDPTIHRTTRLMISKIYNNAVAESLKSTDVATFVGILSLDPYVGWPAQYNQG